MADNARAKASTKYNQTHVRQIRMNLNRKTDADILMHLEDIDNIQGYLKQLIRQDMNAKDSL